MRALCWLHIAFVRAGVGGYRKRQDGKYQITTKHHTRYPHDDEKKNPPEPAASLDLSAG